jgi:hypothetical protein
MLAEAVRVPGEQMINGPRRKASRKLGNLGKKA